MLRRTLIAGLLVGLAAALPVSADSAVRPLPAGSPFTTRAVNRAVAREWAARILSALELPPGAVRSAGKPAGTGRSLASPGFALTSRALVDDTSWWTIDERPAAVLAFVRAHLPRARRIVGHGVGGEAGHVTDGFWSYATPSGLTELTAAVQADRLRSGRTAVRLDGEATWLVPRPAWDRIPDTVQSVTYTARATTAGLDGARPSHGRSSVPRTLGRRDALELAEAIDDLQRMQPGVAYSCPFDPVQPRITLRFRGPGGRPVAVAVDFPAGCASLTLSVGGRLGPPLNDMAAHPLPIDERMIALGAISPCRTGQIVAGPSALTVAGPRPTLTLSLRDRSDAVCTVRGFPRIALLDSRGGALADRDRALDPGALRHAGLAGTVILYPGSSAQLAVRYAGCPGRSRAASARIGIPGAGSVTAQLASVIPGVSPCRRTLLRVSALSPAL